MTDSFISKHRRPAAKPGLYRAVALALGLLCTSAMAQQAPAPTPPADIQAVNLYPIEQIPITDTSTIPVLDFKNTDIRDVLRAIGMQYGVNIYLEPDVAGAISLYLVDIKVRDAIDFIVRRSKYAYRVRNGVVQIYKYEAPPPPPPKKPPVVFHVKGGLLTLDLDEVAAGEVARLFADSAGINVVIEGDRSKQISGHLRDLPPDKALRVLFESSGYDIAVSDGVYYASPQSWGGDGGNAQAQGRRERRLGITVGKDGMVTMEVDNASLDNVVRTISIESGINIFIYDQLSGTITAKCTEVGIDDALRFLLQNTKFTFWKDRDIYFIGSREMSQQKTTVVIPLRHIMAEESSISAKLPPNVTKDAVIKYDSEHNAVIVIGSFDIVAQAEEFIKQIDRPIPQVLIEALVVDFNVSKIRSFGLSLFTAGAGDTTGRYPSEDFLPTLRLQPGRNKTQRILNEVLRFINVNHVVNLPENFRASIHALETADIVKVHSTPLVATINGNAASITIGETRYYKLRKETKTATGITDNVVGTDERFEQKQFDTRLEVTPWVMDSGYVMVKIRPEFNIPRSGGAEDRPPTIDRRVLESMVRLRNGQTIVLGGQRQSENVVNSAGVPFLSSIPILGWLFSNKTYARNETQMMIFLTPHVYYGNEGEVKPDDYFGDEINKMLEQHDPEKKREARQARRDERLERRAMRARRRERQRRLEEQAQHREGASDESGFRWPWELIRERRERRNAQEQGVSQKPESGEQRERLDGQEGSSGETGSDSQSSSSAEGQSGE